jgi:hypothetical protein
MLGWSRSSNKVLIEGCDDGNAAYAVKLIDLRK